MLKHILPLIPPHRVYVEPFCGSAVVMFGKEPAKIEVLNDTNGRLINFMRVLRDRPAELQRVLDLTPYSRRESKLARELSDDSVEDARRFFVCHAQNYMGISGRGWLATNRTSRPHTLKNYTDRIDALAARIRTAHLDDYDAIKVIKNWDCADAFFFIDPPYVGTEQGHYKGYKQADLDRLIKTLQSVKGKFILCGYPKNLKMKNLHIVEIKLKAYGINIKKRNSTEVMAMNFTPSVPT
jgi:DNA adenine methylase